MFVIPFIIRSTFPRLISHNPMLFGVPGKSFNLFLLRGGLADISPGYIFITRRNCEAASPRVIFI